jgi:hypothetical protein
VLDRFVNALSLAEALNAATAPQLEEPSPRRLHPVNNAVKIILGDIQFVDVVGAVFLYVIDLPILAAQPFSMALGVAARVRVDVCMFLRQECTSPLGYLDTNNQPCRMRLIYSMVSVVPTMDNYQTRRPRA